MVEGYSVVAEEYYDDIAHPTCNNFRFLSEGFLNASIFELWARASPRQPILEVGAGRSVVAPLLDRIGESLRSLTLQDISAAMLKHSSEWGEEPNYLICDARSVPLPDASQALIVSSLGDPYNDEPFLDEIARLLTSGGHFLITTPSHLWASAFRGSASAHDAEFALRDGRLHFVPSITWNPARYLAAAEARGLMLLKFRGYRAEEVVGRLSPKLRLEEFSGPVLEGYWFQKSPK